MTKPGIGCALWAAVRLRRLAPAPAPAVALALTRYVMDRDVGNTGGLGGAHLDRGLALFLPPSLPLAPAR